MAKKSVETYELSALRMPGFNAEASLAKINQHYALIPGSAGVAGAVIPQRSYGVAVVGHQAVAHEEVMICYSDGICGFVTSIIGLISSILPEAAAPLVDLPVPWVEL